MATVLVFMFKHALRLILAWLVLSFLASVLIGSAFRKLRGDD